MNKESDVIGIVPKIRLTPPPTPYGVWRMWEYTPPRLWEFPEIAMWRYGYTKVHRVSTGSIYPAMNVAGLYWLDERSLPAFYEDAKRLQNKN